ncbi:DUF4920 domain-containing protein [Antarcticibacterium flavum]|uniref:DUF4920 domain-containing protein n=1 Tax=Antarcticibacterium flavum TaxID=2058175 RepID=A0A5B7X2B4_9FLAO|nr:MULTISPECIES: DUF4920 domain-containing protein [Antarcticibacterium]MCM4160745.1 DUF4920 domain-containing protein [Antarcticibacterium sp. W02-3]QCY68778.1 DUF4920 domain-containing protein [Antarcticibacterium flavum]
MKNLWILPVFIVITLISCKNTENQSVTDDSETSSSQVAYAVYGEEFRREKDLDSREMSREYSKLQTGDTLEVQFTGTVESVCKNKGCWMTLDLPEEEEDVMVKFKDYGFFVPKDIENREVVLSGKAYIEEVSVEEQRHYAEDQGKTQEEIDAITEPKKTLSFLADGVLIKE